MEKIICYCKNVSKGQIKLAISEGAKTLNDIKNKTGACTGNQCHELNPSGKCCSAEINRLLNDTNNSGKSSCCCCH